MINGAVGRMLLRPASAASGCVTTSVRTLCMVLMRHGQTQANLNRLVDGQTDSELTDLGRRQARAAGEALRDTHFRAAYASDLKRAMTTAREVLTGQGSQLDVKPIKLLRERNFGAMDGRHVDEYKAHPEFDGWGGKFRPEGAETHAEVRARAKQFFEAFVNEHAGEIGDDRANYLVVSHGVVIFELARHLVHERGCSLPENADRDAFLNSVAPNTSITKFRVSDADPKVECIVAVDIEHLKNVTE